MLKNVFSRRIGLKIGLSIAGIIIIVIALLVLAVIINVQRSMLDNADNIMASRARSIGNYINFQMRDAVSSGLVSAENIGLLLDSNKSVDIETLSQEAYIINKINKSIVFSGIYLNLNGGDSMSKDGIFAGSFQEADSVKLLDRATTERIMLSSQTPQTAFKSAKPILGNPTLRNINGKDVYTISANFPIFHHGKVVGLIQQRINLDFLNEALTHSVGKLVYGGVDRYIVNEKGIIVADTLKQYRGKTLADINNTPEFKQDVIDKMSNFSDVSHVTSFRGIKRALSTQTFIIPPFNLKWSALITVPESEILKDLYSLVTFIIIASIVAIIVIILLFYFYIEKTFIKRLKEIQTTLVHTFAFINHESREDVKRLDFKQVDELGVMAKAIDSAMDKTRNSLSKDSSAVSQALEVAKTIEEGNLSIRITKNPANPQLLELKDVLNNMLDVLETKIGSNMNEIERVFDSYLRLDFSTSVLDDKGNIANKGSVERVTNALGEEIRKMLKSSLSFASLLNEEAKKLNTQITNLSTSSNAQASSLEQSATAIEEITQSMQN
ncbi:methyl-accepting chemotaxis protein, partial [Helicobacter sp. 11S02629-2]|uniref:PDC sensor domain-containing protein n=1 Tax=Helicobacter sp. 11S02629-2 TaxID=1476195 RepID=UPI000BA5E9FE